MEKKSYFTVAAVAFLLLPTFALGYQPAESDSAKAGDQLAQVESAAEGSIHGIPADEQRRLIAKAEQQYAQIKALQEQINNSSEFSELESAFKEVNVAYNKKHSALFDKIIACNHDKTCEGPISAKLDQLGIVYLSLYPIGGLNLSYGTKFTEEFIDSVSHVNAIGIRLRFSQLFRQQKEAVDYLNSLTPASLREKTAKVRKTLDEINAIEA